MTNASGSSRAAENVLCAEGISTAPNSIGPAAPSALLAGPIPYRHVDLANAAAPPQRMPLSAPARGRRPRPEHEHECHAREETADMRPERDPGLARIHRECAEELKGEPDAQQYDRGSASIA